MSTTEVLTVFGNRCRALCGMQAVRVPVLILLVGALYANSTPNGFNGDDNLVLLDIPAVHGLSLRNLKDIFTSTPNSLEYLPVRDLSYAVDYSLWALNPFGYHLASVVYYAAASLCLYFFLIRLLARWSGKGRAIAFWATVIFIVHPVHVVSVAGIAHRNDILSGLFLFASLWSFTAARDQGGKQSLRVLSVAFAGLALLSKSTAIVLPALILLLDLLPQRLARPSWKKILLNLFPYLLLTGILATINIVIARDAGRLSAPFTTAMLPTAFRAVMRYLGLLVYPYPLKEIYEFPLSSGLAEPAALAAFAGVAALIVFAVRCWRSQAIPAFSIAWFLLCLTPVVGLVPSSTAIIAERYLFLPSVGFSVFLAWVFVAGNNHRVIGILCKTVFAGVFCSWVSLVVVRNREWKNIITLWSAEVRRNPDSPKINLIYARVLFINGFHPEAMDYFRRTRALDPSDRSYEFFSALHEYQRGNFRAALAILDGLGYQGMADVQHLYGLIFAATGDHERARGHFHNALASRVTISIFTKRQIGQALDALE